MKTKEKRFYLPPTVRATQVTLEEPMAIHSPIQQVNLENWSYDEYLQNHESNNADVWLDL